MVGAHFVTQHSSSIAASSGRDPTDKADPYNQFFFYTVLIEPRDALWPAGTLAEGAGVSLIRRSATCAAGLDSHIFVIESQT